MITPHEYNSLVDEYSAEVRPKIAALLEEKIRAEAGRLQGMPFSFRLVKYVPMTPEEKQDYVERSGRTAPKDKVDWKLNVQEAKIAVEILKDAGWYVKHDHASWRYGYGEVTANDEPFPDEPDKPSSRYIPWSEQAIEEFNAKPWIKRLFTTRIER